MRLLSVYYRVVVGASNFLQKLRAMPNTFYTADPEIFLHDLKVSWLQIFFLYFTFCYFLKTKARIGWSYFKSLLRKYSFMNQFGTWNRLYLVLIVSFTCIFESLNAFFQFFFTLLDNPILKSILKSIQKLTLDLCISILYAFVQGSIFL